MGNDVRSSNESPHGFAIVRLEEVAELTTGFPFKSKEYSSDLNDPRLLGGDNIIQGRLRWENTRRWPSNQTDGLDQYWLSEGDVVLAMDRPWIEAGLKYARVGGHDLPALLVQRTARMRGTDSLDTRYLQYVIGSPAFTNYVLAVQTGTAVPHISPSQIKSFTFPLPPLPEQRRIASILGSLDDKIELNRRTSATLEAMARALFKSWFVDFDPVRQKASGQQPFGMDAATAALFPDSFQDSPLGKIPKGWEVKAISDVGRVVTGKTPPTADRTNFGGPYLFVKIPDMHDRFWVSSTAESLSEAGHLLQPSKLVGRGSVAVSCIATVGLCSLIRHPSHTNQQINVVLPNTDVSSAWLLLTMRSLRNEFLSRAVGGSVTKNLNKGHFESIPIVVPPASAHERFQATVDPITEAIASRESESRFLEDTRDRTLPHLMT